MVDSLKGIVEHINTSSQQLNTVSSDMLESATSVNEVARNAFEASSSADEANEYSNNGMVIVDEVNTNISTLMNGISDVQQVMNKLENEVTSISGIVEVIQGISEQTNLLALNAAIEAARAGEQGRGFAVVADEVRNLATRTQESTNEIQSMISSLQSETKNSVELMQMNVEHTQLTADKSSEASEALNAIRTSISTIKDVNNQIAAAAEEQTHVAGEINESIVDINTLAKSTFDSSEKSSNISQELSTVAVSLNDSIEVFKL